MKNKNKSLNKNRRLRSKAGKTIGNWALRTDILTVTCPTLRTSQAENPQEPVNQAFSPSSRGGRMTRTESPSYKTSQSGVEMLISYNELQEFTKNR